jgi:hypothetical protein
MRCGRAREFELLTAHDTDLSRHRGGQGLLDEEPVVGR